MIRRLLGAALAAVLSCGIAAAQTTNSISISPPLAVPSGGTGIGTATTHGVVLGEGTGALGVTAAGASGQCLVAAGAGADPAWGSCSGSGGGGSLPWTNVVSLGADPTGVSDSAPAFRSAMASNRRIIIPPGTYLLNSTQTAPCCAQNPTAVLVQSFTNFEIDGYGATIEVGSSIPLSSAFQFDSDKNFVVRGLTIQGNTTGLTSSQENVGITLTSDVDFAVRDIHFTSGFNAGAGAAIDGDWLVNGTLSNILIDGSSFCADVAYLKNVSFNNFNAIGVGASGTGAGNSCFSVIVDPPNASDNHTGISYTETTHVSYINNNEQNYNTGLYFTTGTYYTLSGNHWHDNPGTSTGSVEGVGVQIGYVATNSAGVPPQHITINGDTFANNGATVPGYGLLVNGSAITNSDLISDITINGSTFDNNDSIGAGALGPTHISSTVQAIGNIYSGSLQTTGIDANLASVSQIFSDQAGDVAMNTGALVIGSPTGGNKGSGTVNATGIYVNGASLGAGVSSSGTITSGDCVKWTSSTQVGDAGASCGSTAGADVSSSTVTATGAPDSSSLATRFSKMINVVTDYGAVADGKNDIIGTITCTSGSAALTSTRALWASGDVGKAITVDGCGPTATTGQVTAIPVSGIGSGYTGMPSVSLSNTGSGGGLVAQPVLALVSATVVSGGSGCTNGTETFQIPLAVIHATSGANGIQAAQIQGTVSGGALSGTLTVNQAGQLLTAPADTTAVAVAIQGGTCTSSPTLNLSYGVGSILVTGGGENYPTSGMTASISGGSPGTAATLGTPTVAAAVQPWVSTISSYTSATSVTLSTNASTSQNAVNGVTWGTDNTTALTNAFTQSNTDAGNGIWRKIYFPSGAYYVTSALPVLHSNPAGIYGDGQYRTWILLGGGYSGPAIAYSDTWQNSGFNNTPPIAAVWKHVIGPTIEGISIAGDASAANEQDAFQFYDRVDGVVMFSVEATNVSRFIESGTAKNTATGFLRESYFNDLYCEFCGSPLTPAIEINSVAGAADASNNLYWYNVDMWGLRGQGLVIRNNDTGLQERRMRFYTLRLERDTGLYAGDLLQIGDPTEGGQVADVSIYGFAGNTPGVGSSAIGFYAASAAKAPTHVIIEGSVNAGGNSGNGLNLQAGTYNQFTFQGIQTTQYSIEVGSSTLVGVGNTLTAPDEQGFVFGIDPTSVGNFPIPSIPITVSQLPSCSSAIRGTSINVSDASSPSYNATLSGGGSSAVIAFCNPPNWTAH